MAFCRSSLLLRKAYGGSRRAAAVCFSYGSLLEGSPSYSDRRRWYSSSEGTTMSASGYNVNGGPSHMRGAVFWEANKPLTFEDFEMPRPKANEVLVKTKACGVCHSDLHVLKGELPFATPCVVGHEITGEVVEHGPMTDSKISERFPVGSQVVGAFIMPCGSCFFCSKGQDDLCESFFAYNRAKGTLYDGETRLFLRGSGKPVYMYSMGGLAEFCVVPAHGLTELPKTLPYTESAVLGCAVFTAYGAMAHAAQVRPGDAIAVIGIGGVGSSCLQIAKAFGASEIIAVDVQDEKLQKAKIFGATHAINARKEDAVAKIKEITGGRGVDVAVEAIGRPQTFSQCVQSVRDGGKAVMIGLTLSGAKGEVDINHLVRRQIKVIGSYGGRARQDLPKLVKLAEKGTFNLQAAVSRKYKFEEVEQAYQNLDQGSIVGRGVVEIM
ncbi:GroES-like zinc-binding alcohol dehydrogenase family protein [Perilla frutescens var. hirtella]|uniref:GroES-like zinc-binding alcohol dehydrogenase family protein n=1 Tax=Perilla frutescens var. hirtella TaxID=608512 RepID=A0AAD4P4A7_PERFH|nr:GroES-like zinc-binding alcohol dehydrogenase family protein [Perilla frutescens var. hirtella]